MDHIALLILGIFIAIIGIVNIMGNISTIHSYNRRKVREEDVPKYGRAVGTGTLIIGVSLIAAFVTTFWSENPPLTAGLFPKICSTPFPGSSLYILPASFPWLPFLSGILSCSPAFVYLHSISDNSFTRFYHS